MFGKRKKQDVNYEIEVIEEVVTDKPLSEKQLAKEQKKRLKAIASITQIIPIREINTELECFIREDQTLVDILQIIPKDLNRVGSDVTSYDERLWEKFYKIYKDDFKIIVMDYPVDVTKNIKYFKKKLKNTNNPEQINTINEKIEELEYLSNNRNNREFYLMVFSDDYETHKKNIVTVKGTLQELISEISINKKIKVFAKLANKNTVIL